MANQVSYFPDLHGPSLALEGLRFDPSLHTWRKITTRQVDIGGVEVPAGAKLLLLIGSANHDPARFPDPDRFDVHSPNSQQHLTFGRGIHACFVLRWRAWRRGSCWRS